MAKKLLVLEPSFRQNKNDESLAALERYDGVFRVVHKYLRKVNDVDVIVMEVSPKLDVKKAHNILMENWGSESYDQCNAEITKKPKKA